jgi:hypothetical protein
MTSVATSEFIVPECRDLEDFVGVAFVVEGLDAAFPPELLATFFVFFALERADADFTLLEVWSFFCFDFGAFFFAEPFGCFLFVLFFVFWDWDISYSVNFLTKLAGGIFVEISAVNPVIDFGFALHIFYFIRTTYSAAKYSRTLSTSCFDLCFCDVYIRVTVLSKKLCSLQFFVASVSPLVISGENGCT